MRSKFTAIKYLPAVVLMVSLALPVFGTQPRQNREPWSPEVMELLREAQLENESGPLSLRMQEFKRQKEEAAATGIRLRTPVLTGVTPVLLGNYTDEAMPFSVSQMQDLLFDNNPTGSMTDYFDEVSSGQYNLTGTVFGPFTADSTMEYYGGIENGLSSNYPRNSRGFIHSLLDDADISVDFSLFDNDGPDGTPNSGDDDGYVDVLTVVCAGGDTNNGENDNIHPHAGSLTSAGGSEFVTNDAASGGGFIKIKSFTIQMAEKGDGSLDEFRGIGVYVHEYGHKIGLPDQYDGDYSSWGIGRWCLMALGAGGANGAMTSGHRPTHMCGWCKVQLGWIIPTVVSGTESVSIPSVVTNPVIYKLWDDPFQWGQYFLLENRTRDGFDSDIHGEGVLIWHCNNDVGGGNSTDDFRLVDLEEADGLDEIDYRMSRMDDGDPYPGGTSNTSFTDVTYPSSNDVYGLATGVIANNFAYVSGPGSNVTVDLTQRNVYGYTIANHGYAGFGGWGYNYVRDCHGVVALTAGDAGTLVSILAAQRTITSTPYEMKLYESMVADVPTNLITSTSGDFPDIPIGRYYEIMLPSAMSLTAGQPFVVDVEWKNDTYAVPFTSRRPHSGLSWWSGNGVNYSHWTNKDVLIRARVVTDCADYDSDGLCAYLDNCPEDANSNQTDSDDDGIGDACDPCPFDAANDADGDGYCADLDNCPDIANPSQTDLNGNSIGDACECDSPQFIITGEAEGDWLGWRVAGAGDFDGDGFDDVIVGGRYNDEMGMSAGKAYIFSGLTEDTLMVILGEAPTDDFGQSVDGAGDVNNDGFDDVIIGSYGCDQDGENSGRAYLFYGGPGPYPKTDTAFNADMIFHGAADYDNLGWCVAGIDDIDGDTCSEVIIASVERGSSLDGFVDVFSGKTGDKLYTFTSEGNNEWFGYEAADAGDVNDDGIPDIVIGAFLHDGVAAASGRVYVFYGGSGPYPITRSAAAADMIFSGDYMNHTLGSSVAGAGDVNNDGYDDIITGAYWPVAGFAYVYSGFDGAILHSLAGVTAAGRLGWSVTGVGDVDGDGFDDVAAGAPKEYHNGVKTGAAFVYSGQTGEIIRALHGEADGDNFGRYLKGGFDRNGDGISELFVGAQTNDSGGADAGRAYVFGLGGDADGDGVLAGCDNCVNEPNPGQDDYDGDGIGDACELGCCVTKTGNVNCDETNTVDIGDLTRLIDYLFISYDALCCVEQANTDGVGEVDIGDLTTLIDFLFISFTPLVDCS